ncbi:hypothetical protein [Staphylococcus arlettae]|uniref:hypothetical protein n=1 Tax=Staphylococcus arlettae TaxID=29378 RepID=UPI0021D1651E|nr:hypothetical protein [Staphylococcus arlettae]UXU51830.1 hypothetical protein MUA71_09785 [Staphylococcus arlettae]
MNLSNTSKIKYKIDNQGKNTVEMAKLLKEYRVSGFLISMNDRSVTMYVPQDAIKNNRKAMEVLRNDT